MKLATWNINSVRLRAELVKEVLLKNKIDVLCLQEIKTEDEFFPAEFFKNIGYNHLAFSGQKSYNGVAIISKKPLSNIQTLEFYNPDKRHISAAIEHNTRSIELHNFYVPAGGDEPDVNINPKFLHKLQYTKMAARWLKKNRKRTDNIILVGDLNIAPYEHDVWSHKQLLGVVSHTPIEVEALAQLKASIDFLDVARKFVPEAEKLYSWWSYRNRDWRKSNRGRRLDHIWVAGELKNQIKKFEILADARDFEKPSDHVPVIVEL
jgi:exodeoxyribonuclease III